MKGNLLLGTARGKLGDVVMYRQRGKQMARVRITKVSNPRTLAQVVQRVVFNTAIHAYSKMQDICNHSFQGMERSVENQAEFMRLNVRILNSYIASQENPANASGFLLKDGQGLTLQPWQISKGNLPVPTIVGTGNDVLELIDHNSTTTGIDLYELSYGQVADKLGVPYGSQITVCLFMGYPDEPDETMGFAFGRFVLMPADGDADTPFFVKNEPTQTIGINSPNPANTITNFGLMGNAEDGYQISVFNNGTNKVINSSSFYGWSGRDGNIVAYSLITSQYVNKTWRRSSSFVIPFNPDDYPFPQLYWTLKDAAESWSEGVWSSKYLNKGENPYNDSVVEDEWNGIKERYPDIAAVNEAEALAEAEAAEALAEGVLTRKRRRKSDD